MANHTNITINGIQGTNGESNVKLPQYVVNEGDGKQYELIDDPKTYVEKLQASGAEQVTAVKVAKGGSIMVRKSIEGEQITSWSQDGVAETVSAGIAGSYVATKVDDSGSPVIDDRGHTNEWQITADELKSRYIVPEGNLDNIRDGAVLAPAGTPRHLTRVDRDIAIDASWGERQFIGKNGWLNHDDMDNIYGLSERDFADTHQIIATH